MPWCNLADSPVNRGQEPTQSSLTSGQRCRNAPRRNRKSSETAQAEVGPEVRRAPAALEQPTSGRRSLLPPALDPRTAFRPPTSDLASVPGHPRVGISVAGAVEPAAFLAVLTLVTEIWLFSIPIVQPSPHRSSVYSPRQTQVLDLHLAPMAAGRDGMGRGGMGRDGMGWDPTSIPGN